MKHSLGLSQRFVSGNRFEIVGDVGVQSTNLRLLLQVPATNRLPHLLVKEVELSTHSTPHQMRTEQSPQDCELQTVPFLSGRLW